MNLNNEMQKEPLILKAAPSFSAPLVTKTVFAELVGVTVRTVDGWVNKGYLPSVKVGRHSLVNNALIFQQCLERGE